MKLSTLNKDGLMCSAFTNLLQAITPTKAGNLKLRFWFIPSCYAVTVCAQLDLIVFRISAYLSHSRCKPSKYAIWHKKKFLQFFRLSYH